MNECTPVKFVNNSVSGLERMYGAFRLKIPGHSTVELPVPNELIQDISEYLKQNHPAIVVTLLSEQAPEAQGEEANTGNESTENKEETSGEETPENASEENNVSTDTSTEFGLEQAPEAQKGKHKGGNRK